MKINIKLYLLDSGSLSSSQSVIVEQCFMLYALLAHAVGNNQLARRPERGIRGEGIREGEGVMNYFLSKSNLRNI
jgi:hypothetical protein